MSSRLTVLESEKREIEMKVSASLVQYEISLGGEKHLLGNLQTFDIRKDRIILTFVKRHVGANFTTASKNEVSIQGTERLITWD